jgi:hypothetical protein
MFRMCVCVCVCVLVENSTSRDLYLRDEACWKFLDTCHFNGRALIFCVWYLRDKACGKFLDMCHFNIHALIFCVWLWRYCSKTHIIIISLCLSSFLFCALSRSIFSLLISHMKVCLLRRSIWKNSNHISHQTLPSCVLIMQSSCKILNNYNNNKVVCFLQMLDIQKQFARFLISSGFTWRIQVTLACLGYCFHVLISFVSEYCST